MLPALRTATLALVLAGAALPAVAQTRIEALGLSLTATPTLATDYLFRGISQTRNRPAVQGTLEALHDSGFYLGAFVSNLGFAGTNARQEVDALAGYRFTLGGINWDIGAIYYSYPGYSRPNPAAYNLDYIEGAVRANREFGPVTVSAAVNVSPNFFGQSGTGVYLESGLDVKLPLDFTASGRLAYQWIQREPRFGTPDYLWYSIGIAREIPGGIVLGLGYYGTDIERRNCSGGQKICDERVLFTISRKF
ncbi:TorF family putative porin [Roseomonas sp. BN140053]|uniref:TorF family putative porin n=1 Tax=Roseomonas sp. BN140053 TaxID=3391898 RepID=UPI0039EA4E2E